MKEQFVPYEIALKLKEKGFNETCLAYYNKLPNHKEFQLFGLNTPGQSEYTNRSLWNKKDYACAAPLWQQVIDWFREKHQIEIVLSGITVYDIRQYHICLYYNVDGIMTDHAMLLFDEETREYTGYQTFTYPEARQTAIEHALTLI